MYLDVLRYNIDLHCENQSLSLHILHIVSTSIHDLLLHQTQKKWNSVTPKSRAAPLPGCSEHHCGNLNTDLIRQGCSGSPLEGYQCVQWIDNHPLYGTISHVLAIARRIQWSGRTFFKAYFSHLHMGVSIVTGVPPNHPFS